MRAFRMDASLQFVRLIAFNHKLLRSTLKGVDIEGIL